MSSGFSNGIRVFRGCRALLAPSKSPAAVGTVAAKSKATSKSKEKDPPSSDDAVTAAAPKPKIKRETTRPTGILKVAQVSPALSNFLGVSEVSRTNAVKQIWSYIKLHNLQNPANKREIVCDDKLKAIFEGREKPKSYGGGITFCLGGWGGRCKTLVVSRGGAAVSANIQMRILKAEEGKGSM